MIVANLYDPSGIYNQTEKIKSALVSGRILHEALGFNMDMMDSLIAATALVNQLAVENGF